MADEIWIKAAIAAAVEQIGSQAKLGEILGCSQTVIYRAIRDGRVSPRLAASLHQWSRGRISKHELRPDVFGAPRRRRAMEDSHV
jgi:DNA-binding transcriptional regulator YdaS (Cro superfamily)